MAIAWEPKGTKGLRDNWLREAPQAHFSRSIEVRAMLQSYTDRLTRALEELPFGSIEAVVDLMLEAQYKGSTVYVFGNGGSASTAAHLACDLQKAAMIGGLGGLRVLTLTDNMAIFSALANNVSYERVFAEQLESSGRMGDIAIAISASGNSPNVIEAVKTAGRRGMRTIGLSGVGGSLIDLVDIPVVVRSSDHGTIEDAHMVIGHTITTSLKAVLAGSSTHSRPEDRIDQAIAWFGSILRG